MKRRFMPESGIVDAVFMLWQMLEKYHMAGKKLCMVFVDLEKAFRHVLEEML